MTRSQLFNLCSRSPYDYSAVYSTDDGGWYCEVFNFRTGATIGTTEVFARKADAVTKAMTTIGTLALADHKLS